MTVARDANTGMVTGTTLGNVATSNEYNGFGEASTFTAAVSGAYLFGQIIERDNLGRVTSIEEQVGATPHALSYTYDHVGRLSSATRDGVKTTDGYDSNGNRNSVQVGSATAVTATFDAQDRVLTQGTATFEPTPHGDLLHKTDGANSSELTYDELGNLLEAKVTSGTTTKTVDYVVDGMGRRVGRQVNGVFDRKWLYRDGLRPIAEVDSAGTFTHFVYAEAQSGAPDFMIRSGVLLRVVKDHLGSVRTIVNAQTGAILQAIEYDAFGVVLSDTNPGFQPFGFAGGLYDAVTGLVRFGARDYDASIGRWTNKDPIGFAGGDTNIYAYVGNDPVNLVDPSGLRPLTANEKAFLSKYYGKSLNVDEIDVGVLPEPLRAMGIGGMSPYGGKILLPQRDFKKGNGDNELVLSSKYVGCDFAHEAFHVWQRQHGRLDVSIGGLSLGIGGAIFGVDVYDYFGFNRHDVYMQFLAGGIEQQARIFEHVVKADMERNALNSNVLGEVAAYVRAQSL
jgi:RHS repeat-associated protein